MLMMVSGSCGRSLVVTQSSTLVVTSTRQEMRISSTMLKAHVILSINWNKMNRLQYALRLFTVDEIICVHISVQTQACGFHACTLGSADVYAHALWVDNNH